MIDPDETTARPDPRPLDPRDVETLAPDETASELVRLLDAYMAALQAGEAPDRSALLAAHPGLASQLEPCLAGIDFIHKAASPETSGANPSMLGEFRIVREVGRGGMGVVYEAEQTSLRRKVALKVLRFGVVADEEALRRFRVEAETVARLHHTNIVPIFAVGTDQDVSYYAMQFIDGRSLADILEASNREGRPIAAEDVARWGLQAAEALTHAHQRRVIHRDIKPSNLLIDKEGVVWLTDFGLAKRSDEVTLTLSGTLMGTPRYMSPEQAEAMKRPVDHRTDLYSLGASLYELATGRPVFESPTAHGVILQVLNAEPVAPRSVRPNIPRDLETILMTCLAKAPDRRYATAQALAEDLRSYLEGRAIKARRTPIWEKAGRLLKRQKKSFAVGSIAAAATVLLVAVGLVSYRINEEAKLGNLTLNTSGDPLTAEVFKADSGERVVEPFTVPTRSPVPLPEGDYRVRLTAPARPSETYQLRLERGLVQDYAVDLSKRSILKSIKEGLQDESWRAYPFPLGGGRDLIEVNKTSISRVTSYLQQVWSFKPGEPGSVPSGSIAEDWMGILWPDTASLNGSTTYERLPGVLQPMPDLDGDGVGDVVISCRLKALIFALSGKDGKILWHRSLEPDLVPTSSRAGCAGETLTFAGPDGPVLVTTFELASAGSMGIESRRVVAIDGRNGQPIWQRAFARHDGRSIPAHRLKLAGKDLVGVVSGPEWVALDPLKGDPIGDRLDFNLLSSRLGNFPTFDLLREPIVADLDGDGSDDLLVLMDSGHLDHPELLAVSTKGRRKLWTAPVHVPFQVGDDTRDRESIWPRVADLDGDGRAEAIVPYQVDHVPANGKVVGDPLRSAGLRVLDGRDGRERWAHRLLTNRDILPSAQSIAGPDIDGDGVRDVFVASILSSSSQGPGEISGRTLYVDALSGRNGQSLWWWSHPLIRPSDQLHRPLRWWEPGPDGFPKLVIDTGNNALWVADPAPPIYTLAASTGQPIQEVFHLKPTGSADVDGDGLPEIWGTTSTVTSQGMVVVQRVVVSGKPPEAWKRLGRWAVASDYDRDGLPDLIGPDTSRHAEVDAISGRDGHILWKTKPVLLDSQNWSSDNGLLVSSIPLPEKAGDLDGDGVPELALIHDRSNSGAKETTVGLSVCSGRTGKVLWENPRIPHDRTLGWCAPCKVMALDADGGSQPDLLALLFRQGSLAGTNGPIFKGEFHLARFSGATGQLIWISKVADRNRDGTRDNGLSFRDYANTLADLDGDGRPEIVFLLPHHSKAVSPTNVPAAPDKKSEFVAVSTIDGRLVWSHVGGMTLDDSKPFDDAWSRFATGDLNGDGRGEVVLVDVVEGRPRVERWNSDSHSAPRWAWSGSELDGGTLKNVSVIPRLADLDGRGRKSVVVIAYQEKAGSRLVVLDADGRIARSRSIVSKGLGHQLWVHDLDGDGKDEILFEDKGKLRAVRGDLAAELWAWADFDKVKEFRRDASGKPVVVLQNGLAIEGATGRIAWRSEPLWNGELIAGPDHGLPLAVSRLLGETSASLALPARENGVYRSPMGTVQSARPTGDDPRIVRPLPWVIGSPGGLREDQQRWLPWIVWGILGSGGYSFVVLVGPTRILLRLFRRKARIRDLILLPMSAAAAISVYAFLRSNFFGTNGLNMGFPPSLAAVWSVLLAVLGLPILIDTLGVYRILRTRNWRAIPGSFLLWAVGCMIAARILIHFHHRDWMAPDERYSWDGWWTIWLPGLYAAGCLLIAWKIASWPVKRLLRLRRGFA